MISHQQNCDIEDEVKTTLFKVVNISILYVNHEHQFFNPLAPEGCSINSKSIIFKLIIRNSGLDTWCEIAHGWMPQNLTNEKSTLVWVIAWCQAITCANVDWEQCRHIASLGNNELMHTRTKWAHERQVVNGTWGVSTFLEQWMSVPRLNNQDFCAYLWFSRHVWKQTRQICG